MVLLKGKTFLFFYCKKALQGRCFVACVCYGKEKLKKKTPAGSDFTMTLIKRNKIAGVLSFILQAYYTI